VIDSLRARLAAKGTMGIRGFIHTFRKLDNNQSKSIQKTELLDGLKNFDIFLNEEEL